MPRFCYFMLLCAYTFRTTNSFSICSYIAFSILQLGSRVIGACELRVGMGNTSPYLGQDMIWNLPIILIHFHSMRFRPYDYRSTSAQGGKGLDIRLSYLEWNCMFRGRQVIVKWWH